MTATTILNYEPSSQITTISESRPLAATSHTCTVCGRAILKGTKYSRILLRRDDALDKAKSLTVIKWHLPMCPVNSEAAS